MAAQIPNTAADSLATRVLIHSLQSLFIPVARLAIRFRIPCDLVTRAMRAAFVKGAIIDQEKSDKRPSDVAIQAMTGLPRKSIAQIQSAGILEGRSVSPLAKVLGGWCADPEFQHAGEPMALPMRTVHSACFFGLVRKYAPDLAYRPVLNQLLESGNVSLNDDCVRLISTMYDPPKDALNAMSAGVANVARHMETVYHNLTASREGRITERKRLSRYVPAEMSATVTTEIESVLEDTDRRIAQILEASESTPDDVELTTIGAGFYLLKTDAEYV